MLMENIKMVRTVKKPEYDISKEHNIVDIAYIIFIVIAIVIMIAVALL